MARKKQNPAVVHFNYGREKSTTKKSTQSPSLIELGWIAGFLEGEGCFCQASVTSNQVKATQVNKEPILKLLTLLGGHISYRNTSAFYNGKPSWQWAAAGSRARGIMMTVYPLMSKRRQEQIRRSLA